MANNNFIPKSFYDCMGSKSLKIIDRAVGFLYFYATMFNDGADIKQIISDFEISGLGKPNSTILKKMLSKDRRTVKISKDKWRIKSDKIKEIEDSLKLQVCIKKETPCKLSISGNYVNDKYFKRLRKKKDKFDFSRLLKMLIELNDAFYRKNYISVILIVRAILDHVPPVFGFNTFVELANNYKGSKSFKASMINLENSSRNIADSYLHTAIRKKESLPGVNQVDFSNDLDVLLSEILRII